MVRNIIIMLALGVITFSESIAQTSFAILPPNATDLSSTDLETFNSSLYSHLIKSGKYQIVERQKIDKIFEEQALQMTGAVDESKAVEIGKLLAVQKMIQATVYKKKADHPKVDFVVINIETGKIEFSKSTDSEGISFGDLGKFMAQMIINEYPLLGKILGKAGNIFVVDLGADHNLKTGDRLFVAREETLLGDDGEVLFHEVKRIGILRATQINQNRSQAQIKILNDNSNPPQKGDMVSQEPIPKKETLVSHTPLLPDIIKGDLILEDDMVKKKYLTAGNSQGNSYRDGKFILDITHRNSAHAHAGYPAPLDTLKNFIVEGEAEFLPVNNKYNRIRIIFRYDNGYTRPAADVNSYNFYIRADGIYALDLIRGGKLFPILQATSSPVIKRGNAVNTFKIVGYESTFDCYLNDQFIVGFEHELFERGTIGFLVNATGKCAVDNVKIWKAVKK
ncbi:hypothetical protein JW964_27165 [candidate division KSB1 bacterium]|nr:hypothetical protein [candidate division KSB1 bacterium]